MTTPEKNAAGLDANQQATLKKLLVDAQATLTSRRSGQLQARTELASDVEDAGDSAFRANSESTLLGLAESEHARLAEIEHALAKLDAGEYGIDEETGEPIGYARLSALPWARYAASTQEALDRRS
jgi:RNA polymerase-binding transcription factor